MKHKFGPRFGIVGALWFLSLVNYLDRVAMSFAGPFIMASLHITPTAFGIVLSSFSVGYLLAQAPGGMLADRFGARTLLIVGPLLWAAFTGATGLVSTVAAFTAVRLLFGVSEGLSNTSSYKVVGEYFAASDRSRIMAICSTALPLAPAFAGVLIGKLIIAFGWKAMFMLLAGPAVLAALGAYALLPKSTPLPAKAVAAGPDISSFRSVLNRKSLWLLSAASLCWNVPYWGFLGWMPSYLALARHIDLKAVGPLAGVPYIFAFFGLLILGWLGSGPLHRYCARLVIGCFLGAGLSLFVAFEAGSLVLSLTGLSGAAFFLFGASGPIAKILLDLAPVAHRGAYIGVYASVGQLGAVLAPVLIGWLVTRTGSFASGFTVMELAFVAAAVLLFAATQAVRGETTGDSARVALAA